MVDSPAKSPSLPVKPLYLTAAVSSVLLYASFFPCDLGFLIWIALVPLFLLIRSAARPRSVYLASFFGGLLFYLPAVQWMRVAHPAMYATWLILAVYSSLFFPLGLYLIRRFDRSKIPLPLAVPIVWVALEYFRAHFPTGFPWLESLGLHHRIGFAWYFLGYAQHDCLPLIQIADVTGVYGVSLLIALTNVVFFLWVARIPAFGLPSGPRPWISTVVAAIAIAGTVVYGYQRLDHPAFENGPRVAMLQSNLTQSVKMQHGLEAAQHMGALLKQAASSPTEYPDLIVWPETTFEEDWYDVAPGVDRNSVPPVWKDRLAFSAKVARILGEWQTNMLLGLNGIELDADGKIWKYNSAVLINRNGTGGLRYDKMHLVPFGEYVPLRSTFPWMKTFTPYTGDYSCKPGEHWTRFPLAVGGNTYHFGCIICYEDTDPAIARNYVLASPEGPAVDFLINISNDGWFNGTEEHEQHLAICRFRAIECRRSVVRAVNMGISGIIDADGRVIALPNEDWSKSKKVATVVTANVPIDRRDTLYSRWGDWLPIGCWALLLGTLTLGRFWKR